ncbi:hypothetical protein P3T76_005160 [Phytophthora citrophthora]|uniref:Uncharacterized protein n=1 Tax=Phytophthora citrophthora TaxID=4793 RepID=A0AAD9LR42_9STRA|nr:hypothetical protein P3T76_005160 [Phytophthora citrophthora]
MHDQTPLLSQTTNSHTGWATPSRVLAALSLLSVLAVAVVIIPSTTDSPSPIDQDLAQQSSLADAPSLRLHFSLKRSSMEIFGHSEFDIFTNPVISPDNTTVLYDGYAEFVDETTSRTLLLVDGIVYYVKSAVDNASTPETARCIAASSLPPLNSIITALNDAIPISSATSEGEVVSCPRDRLLKSSLGGMTFVACSLGSQGFAIYGSDLDVTVEYLSDPVDITAPRLTEEEALSCEVVVEPSTVTPVTLALLTGQSIARHSTIAPSRNLLAKANVKLPTSSCSCKSKPRPCLYFHGMGQTQEMKTPQQSFDSYWGNFGENAPCCSSVHYARLDTVNHAWTEASLQQKVCDFSLSVSNTSNISSKTIADTIIITHSMGGLMVGGALANSRCKFAPSTSWVALSAPMTGSVGSDYLQDTCSGSAGFLQAVALLIGRCPANTAVKSLTYETDPRTSPALRTAYKAAQAAFQKNVKAVMCSSNYGGLLSKWQPFYIMAGTMIPHKSKENDGMIEFHSCAGGLPLSQVRR